MTTQHLAGLAVESFRNRPSRERTVAQLDASVEAYAVSYYGTGPYAEDIADMIVRARIEARQRVPQYLLSA